MRFERQRSATGPALFAVIALALLVYNHVEKQVTDLVFWLGLAVLSAVTLLVAPSLASAIDELPVWLNEYAGGALLAAQFLGLPRREPLRVVDVARIAVHRPGDGEGRLGEQARARSAGTGPGRAQ